MIIFCAYNCVFTFIQNSQSLSLGIQLIILRKTGCFPCFGGRVCYLCSWEALQQPWARQPGGPPDASRHLSVEGKPGWPSCQRAGPEGAALVRRPGLGSASCMRSWGLGGPLASVWKVGGSMFPGLGTFPAVLTGPLSSASVGLCQGHPHSLPLGLPSTCPSPSGLSADVGSSETPAPGKDSGCHCPLATLG